MLSAVMLAAVLALPVPFVGQERDTCGAAALAMVLRYWGEEASHDALAARLVEEELRGVRGSRLAGVAREHGMDAIAFAGDLGILRAHVARGRPLILAIDAGRGRLHDVVVVGVDDARGEAILNDPARGAGRRVRLAVLDGRWAKSGRWTLLVQPARTNGMADPSSPGGTGAPRDDGSGGTGAPRDDGSGGTGVPRDDGSGGTGAPRDDGPGEAGAYDGLLAAAVELGQREEYEAALATLDRAAALQPSRPEAWTERGGVRFLQGRYGEAVAALRRSLALREDAYVRDLLGSSLHLAGRELEALAAWNTLGLPTLHAVELGGLERTRDEVARREIGLAEGELLTAGGVRAARRRLEETGVFDRVTLRPRPRGDGSADLEVALGERHGLGHGATDVLVSGAVNLAWKRVRLRYSNLGGTGLSLGASHRWQENRPETALALQWPRPLGLPVALRLAGFRGEQAYDLDGAFGARRRGVEIGARHVLSGGAVASLAVRLRDREVSVPRPDAPAGLLAGVEAGIEARLLETRRLRLDVTGRLFAGGVRGAGAPYAQADAELRWEAILSEPEGRSVERSVLAARLRGGVAGAALPVDEMYAPGLSAESDLPLRAHPLTRGGVLGANPIGRSVLLANVEWRLRVWRRPTWSIQAAAFSDTAWVGRPASGSAGGWTEDVGAGLRVSFLAGPTVRIDHGWGVRDGRRAFSVALGQAF